MIDIDPLVVGSSDPGELLEGTVEVTVVDGRVLYSKRLWERG